MATDLYELNVRALCPERPPRDEHEDFLDRHSNFVRKVIRDDWDWWTCNEGAEGTGKSSLSIHNAMKVGRELFVLQEHVIYDPEELLRLIDDAPRYGSIVLDEAGEAAFSRDFNTEMNKAIIKASQQMRDRNLHVIFNLPALELLDSALRRRFKTLVISEAPNFRRGRSLWHVPVIPRYGKKSEPYFDLQHIYYFKPLPPAIREAYVKIKTKRGIERVQRYIDQVEKERAKHQDVDPRSIVEKILKLPEAERAKLLSSRGTWSRDRIAYEYQLTDGLARQVCAGLSTSSGGDV